MTTIETINNALIENKSSDHYTIYWRDGAAHLSDGKHSVLIGYESEGLELIDRLPMCEDTLDNWPCNVYDIYTSTDENEPADAHGATHEQDGLNPADAVSKFIAGLDPKDSIREVCASNDDMIAAAYLCEDGTWELHISDGMTETAVITLPNTCHYMSAADAAEILDISRQRVYQLITSGRLHAKYVAGFCLLPSHEVIERAKTIQTA